MTQKKELMYSYNVKFPLHPEANDSEKNQNY